MEDLDTYEEGQSAFWEGLNALDNPYPIDTDHGKIWLEGFNDPRSNA